jgi:osmotically-inducible protein OsmY
MCPFAFTGLTVNYQYIGKDAPGNTLATQIRRTELMVEQALTEQRLQERIQNAISSNPYLPGKRVCCRTDSGRVTLSGKVSSYFQKQMAQEAVRRLDGVRRIENLLEVSWM